MNLYHSEHEFYRHPSKADIEKLLRTHGPEAVAERWWYLSSRTIWSIRQGANTRNLKQQAA